MRPRIQRMISLRPGDVPAVLPVAIIDPPLLSQKEAAKRLGVGIKTLQDRIADGTIYAIPVGNTGKHVKIPVAEIEKWRDGRYGTQPGHGPSGVQQGEAR